MKIHCFPGFVRVVDPDCAAAEMDRRYLAHAANSERGRRLEDAERHRRILHNEKKRVRAEGKAEGFAEGKAEGMQQAMKELEIWDLGFQEGRASAGMASNSNSGRPEQLRIEAPPAPSAHFGTRSLRAPSAPPSQREAMNHGGAASASRAFPERRSIAGPANPRDPPGYDAPHSGYVVPPSHFPPLTNHTTKHSSPSFTATDLSHIDNPAVNNPRPAAGKRRYLRHHLPSVS